MTNAELERKRADQMEAALRLIVERIEERNRNTARVLEGIRTIAVGTLSMVRTREDFDALIRLEQQ